MQFDKNCPIFLDEKTHTYYTADGEIFISVSTLIDLLSYPFDPDGSILKRCAIKKGLTTDDMKAEWKKINKESLVKGSLFHESVEFYIKNGKILNNQFVDLIKQFSKMKFHGRLFSEIKLYSLQDQIAGTTDLIEQFPNKKINIYDFKTNKKLHFMSPWGNKMLHPLSHLDSCNYVHYSLQLNIYKYLLEKMGYYVNDMYIFYVDTKENLIKQYQIDHMPKDVYKIINIYNNELKDKNITYKPLFD
jgi:hypothetical protein